MLKSQIESMRREVQESGENVVRCEKLRALCADVVLVSNQWDALAKSVH
jgi:hypothetical protein